MKFDDTSVLPLSGTTANSVGISYFTYSSSSEFLMNKNLDCFYLPLNFFNF